MDRPTAIEQIRELSQKIATAITSMHPLVPGLEDKPTQDEIFKALFGLTKEVEVVKKQLLKLERRDTSTEL